MHFYMIPVIATCILTLQVESQSYYNQYPQYNGQYTGRSRAVYPVNEAQNITPYMNYTPIISNRFGSNSQPEKPKVTERDSYLQAISRNDNTPHQQLANQEPTNSNDRIYFKQPNEELSPPPVGDNSNPNYYSTQQKIVPVVFPQPTDATRSDDKRQEEVTSGIHNNSPLNNVTVAISNFGISLIKIASQLKPGNVIVSPTSIATLLALLQQGALGDTQEEITRSLQVTPDVSKTAFSTIAADMTKRNFHNILSIANNIYVSDSFELNSMFKKLAIQSFWSEVTPTNFANPSDAINRINAWVAMKTNNKITNLLAPGTVSQVTQVALVNAVYFKGLWETMFNPEKTKTQTFHLSNGEKKLVPFMSMRHSVQVGYDLNTRALVTILPFQGGQYSLILILPKRTDNVANVLSTLTVEQLFYYQTFNKNEISINLPKFTLKTDTDLNPVLKDMGITNIFGSKSDLAGIGLYGNSPPQLSNAVHSGFLSIDEQGVTAAAATALVAVALSYDDSSIIFRADRPFIAVLWDNQFSIPIFMAKIEDPS